MTRLRHARGMTIIETTVMLSVLFILAGVLSPIVSESVTTARAVKAKNDAMMIASGLINLQKDIGADALSYGGIGSALRGVAAASVGSERWPDVLASEGSDPSVDDKERESAVADAMEHPGLLRGPRAADRVPQARRRKWLDLSRDNLNDHLVNNRRGYRLRQPGEYGGWNGPYLSARLAGDPWGNRYMVNTSWLDGGTSAADASGQPRRAVYVVSAGANSILETPFEQPITDAEPYGDDIVIRIQ